MKRRLFSYAFCLAGALLTAACAVTAPTNFYTLVPDRALPPVSVALKVSVAVDAVGIPGSLDRPQIVTLKEEDVELDLSEFNRWVEPLSNAMQRVVAENMAAVLPKSDVKPFLASAQSFDCKVFIEIKKMDGRFGDKAVLSARWSILSPDGRVLAKDQGMFETPLEDGYPALVKAQSELVSKLSVKIAQKIKSLRR